MEPRRRRVRYVAAAAAAAMAAIYYLIGLGVLYIGRSTSDGMAGLGFFGGGAGTAFLVLAALLAFTDRRWIWVLATLAQVWVYVTYVVASGIRDPAFEMWGITLRILQLPVLIALIYLSIKPTQRAIPRGGGAR